MAAIEAVAIVVRFIEKTPFVLLTHRVLNGLARSFRRSKLKFFHRQHVNL